jgi:hypothetical protein
MASNSLGTLTLDLIAKIGGFTGPLDKASRDTKKRMAEIQASATKAGTVLGATIAAGSAAAVVGLSVLVKAQRDLIDTQAKAAQRLRTSYESLTILGRAGELAGVGMDKIEVSAKALEQRLGQAIAGSKEQAAAFDRLGLSAQAVADMPLDQRLATINQALRDNVQASERAAVAGKIFGEEGATMMQMLDPATIAEAARQTELFGLNLSDVDAAKVEMANDAMSTFGLLADGVGKQLTVELAPILKLIGDEFLRSAEEAGGMGNMVQGAVGKTVSALAFVADAADGVSRVFTITADTIIGMLTTAAYYGIDMAGDIVEALNTIPGVDLGLELESLRASADTALAVAREASDNIRATLEKPMAGSAFKQLVDEAMEAADAAAVATVEGRKAAQATGEAIVVVTEAQKAAAKEAEKAARELATAQKKQASDYAALVADLMTDEEKLTAQMRERLDLLKAMTDISDSERSQMAERISKDTLSEAPEFGGLDSSVGGAAGELVKIAEAEQALAEWRETELANQQAFLDQKLINEEQHAARVAEITAENNAKLASLNDAYKVATLGMFADVTGNAADMMKEMAGEGSAAYKIMFLASKAAAIAQAVVSTEVAAAKALELGPIMGIPAASLIRGLGYASVGMITATTLAGMAHDGIDSVPREGTWLLDQGERVVDKRTNGDLKDFLANRSGAAGGGGGAPQVHITISNDGTSDVSAPAGLEQFGAELGRFVESKWTQLTAASLRPGGMLYRNMNGRG